MKIRLNKFLSEAGFGSRRKVEELITTGAVQINDEKITELATMVNVSEDTVSVKGKIVEANPQKIYLLLNKPKSYVVTRQDEYDRKTIYKLLPDFAHTCVSAGRLDMDSEGLLLLTNDGDLIQALTHPTQKVDKTYRVEVDKPLFKSQIEQLRKGVIIDGYCTKPAGVFVKSNKEGNVVFKVIISEGKKRQIRLMLNALGRNVVSLKRLQIGEIELGKLPLGMWRLCSNSEISYLMKIKQKRSQ